MNLLGTLLKPTNFRAERECAKLSIPDGCQANAIASALTVHAAVALLVSIYP